MSHSGKKMAPMKHWCRDFQCWKEWWQRRTSPEINFSNHGGGSLCNEGEKKKKMKTYFERFWNYGSIENGKGVFKDWGFWIFFTRNDNFTPYILFKKNSQDQGQNRNFFSLRDKWYRSWWIDPSFVQELSVEKTVQETFHENF